MTSLLIVIIIIVVKFIKCKQRARRSNKNRFRNYFLPYEEELKDDQFERIELK